MHTTVWVLIDVGKVVLRAKVNRTDFAMCASQEWCEAMPSPIMNDGLPPPLWSTAASSVPILQLQPLGVCS